MSNPDGRPRSRHTHCTRPGCTAPHYARGLCRAHHAKWGAAGRLARRVDAAPARAHLLALVAAGATYVQAASAAGIAPRTAHEIASGKRTTVLSDTVEKILAARWTAPARRPTQTVPSIGTMRRLQALGAIGWSTTALARQPEITCTAMGLGTIRSGEHATCLKGIADEVAAVYSQLWDQPRPDGVQVLNRAAREGWALPMEWDDIDDPATDPVRSRRTGAGQRDAAEERREAIAAWLDLPEAARGSVEALAYELGCTKRTVERDKARIRRERAQEAA
ncbi:hypothetical protein [Tsukamurella sp. NPDC003166]|uniref:hypothetical protein n=1 Tax=Tsukamurella sp. NPDC003166 TaxID=3154444 RepID=UPI0033AFCBCD